MSVEVLMAIAMLCQGTWPNHVQCQAKLIECVQRTSNPATAIAKCVVDQAEKERGR